MYKEFAQIYDEFTKDLDYDLWYICIKEILYSHKIEAETFLDLGCGTGEILIRANEDFQCTGVDISQEMLAQASQKLSEQKIDIPLLEQNMTTLKLDKQFDVIVSLFDTVNHLTSLQELHQLFHTVAKHLAEDAIYIFDVVDRAFMKALFPAGIFHDERENMTVIWEHVLDQGLDLIDANFFVKNTHGNYDRYTEKYTKRIFSKKEIKKAAKDNQLKITMIVKNNHLAGQRHFYCLTKK